MSPAWRIVFMGTPQTAAFTLEHLLQGPDPVIGVVTQPDRPAGRGQKTVLSPVRKLAESRCLSVVAPEKVRDPGFLETLKRWNPQLIVVVAMVAFFLRPSWNLRPMAASTSTIPCCRSIAVRRLPPGRSLTVKKKACHNDEVSGEDGLGTGLFAKGSHAGAG